MLKIAGEIDDALAHCDHARRAGNFAIDEDGAFLCQWCDLPFFVSNWMRAVLDHNLLRPSRMHEPLGPLRALCHSCHCLRTRDRCRIVNLICGRCFGENVPRLVEVVAGIEQPLDRASLGPLLTLQKFPTRFCFAIDQTIHSVSTGSSTTD